IFKQATLLFSTKDTANLADVIPVMDSIDSVLEVGMGTKKYHDSIRLGLALARRTLNRYYSKTDASDAYRVAMLLHPRYKTTYWKDHDWEPEWIAMGVNITRGIYNSPEYATVPDMPPQDPLPINSQSSDNPQVCSSPNVAVQLS
ncbi:hypothetical protein BS47DRAFT_1296707, partial [Hydnum rufescens UP504]